MKESSKKAATQVEIAELLGISQVTVHRALSGHKRVNEKTRERILKAAEEIGYHTNFFASQLRSKSPKLLVLGISYLQDPYCIDITESFERTAAERGYRIFLAHLHDEMSSITFHREILGAHGVKSLALVGGSSPRVSDKVINELLDAGVNVALLGRSIDDHRATQVVSDQVKGGRLAADHFYSLGLRNTWVFVVDGALAVSKRAHAYCERMKELGLPEPRILHLPWRSNIEEIFEATYEVIDRAFDEHPLPEGIFCIGLTQAMAVSRAASMRSLQFGRDLRLIGYGDTWQSRFFYPAITTIRQPAPEIGRAGAECLIDVLEGRREPGNVITFEPNLVVRDT
ncbi:MAG: LacI family DNA-binding transcriptional regulator [Puniceicoccales bacterium]